MIRPGSPEGATETPIVDGASVVPAGLDGAGRDAPRVQGLTPRLPTAAPSGLSAALPRIGQSDGGVASTVNNLAPGEGGRRPVAPVVGFTEEVGGPIKKAELASKSHDPHPALRARPHKWGSPRPRREREMEAASSSPRHQPLGFGFEEVAVGDGVLVVGLQLLQGLGQGGQLVGASLADLLQ